ncbi:MAG: DEAD/DEAH box helicase, partial [Deltaproteobacteria bacterium]|nr:DEAD/DEAH box helicase [Deltaproteobacteria bacterium]
MNDTPPPDAPETWVPTGADYATNRRFSDFPISEETLRGITERGYKFATPVQADTLEPALAGRDMLVRAKTGTGKTCAFAVPVIDRAPPDGTGTYAVVLAPTRELAQQIGEEMSALAKYRSCSVTVLVGGVAMGPQEDELRRKPSIVVGTPGRLLDHLRRKNFSLAAAEVVVLDEADEMLSMGFYEDVTTVIESTKADRQILLFSATISGETQRIVQRYLKDPEQVTLSTDADQVTGIEHILYETRGDTHRARSLLFLLDVEDPASAIIFCNTREDTATVATFLDRQGLDVQLISGELSQARRTQVMAAVKAGEVRFLVSTDVASRGIDISDLSHVINYSLPFDPPIYMHRVGRTGRIGKKGKAISLVGGTDLATRRHLETVQKIQFEVRQLPEPEQAIAQRVERQAAQIRGAMSTMVFESYLPTVRVLQGRPDGEVLLAAALRAFFQWDRQRRARMSESLDTVGDLVEARAEKEDRRRAKDDR